MRIVEDLVAERVESIERDAYVSGRDPFFQLRTVLKVVRTRAVFERAEDDTSARQRRNVAELVGAQSDRFVLMRHYLVRTEIVGFLTARRIVLIRLPRACFRRSLQYFNRFFISFFVD